VGLLVVFILLNQVEALTGWVLRITFGVVIIHTSYGIFHLWRPAGSRTPGNSTAYHLFAGISDLGVIPLYTYGVFMVRNNGDKWGTLLPDKEMLEYFTPAAYYALISAGGFHLLSLAISLWLSIMFRRINNMPPDMNPLEANLTSRVHKRNKSSVATMMSGYTDSDKTRADTPSSEGSRPRSIPFMHTRGNSQTSFGTGNHRDSRMDLPSRQYQITPGNSPRSSGTPADLKRMSAPVPPPSYNLQEAEPRPSSVYSRPETSHGNGNNDRPSNGTKTYAPYRVDELPSFSKSPNSPTSPQPRAPKFTEAWYASESLINRTQERNRAMNQASANAAGKRRGYETLHQHYDLPDSSDSENDENSGNNSENRYSAGGRSITSSPKKKQQQQRNKALEPSDDENDLADSGRHPNPLRSNPTATLAPTPPPKRPFTPFSRLRTSILGEINLNDKRRVSGSQDITDTLGGTSSNERTWQARNRDSSIQPESLFSSKRYDDLRPATPPVMIGGNTTTATKGNRQVSSGNDYADLGNRGGGGNSVFGRRHVSGKVAEEGMVGVHEDDDRY